MDLELELSIVEASKASLLLEAMDENLNINPYFEENQQKKEGLVSKLINGIKNIIQHIQDWISSHFKKDDKVALPEKDIKELNKGQKLLKKIKSGLTNPKVLATIVGTGVIVGAGISVKRHNENEKMKFGMFRLKTERQMCSEVNACIYQLDAYHKEGKINDDTYHKTLAALKNIMEENKSIIKNAKSYDELTTINRPHMLDANHVKLVGHKSHEDMNNDIVDYVQKNQKVSRRKAQSMSRASEINTLKENGYWSKPR